MQTRTSNDPLAILAEKAEGDAFFLGHALRVYQNLHGLSDEDLCRELGVWRCLPSLKLCRAPRDVLDVQIIAAAYRLDWRKLAEIVGIG